MVFIMFHFIIQPVKIFAGLLRLYCLVWKERFHFAIFANGSILINITA